MTKKRIGATHSGHADSSPWGFEQPDYLSRVMAVCTISMFSFSAAGSLSKA
jgi:hypothetical protein